MTETHDDDQTATPDTGNRYTVIGLAIAAVIVVVVLAGAFWMHSSSDTPTPTPTGSSTTTAASPSSTTPTAEQVAVEAAKTTYRAYIKALDDIQASGGKSLGNLEQVAINEARLAGQNTAHTFASGGLRLLGTTQVITTDVLSVDLSLKAVTLRTCIDATGTSVVDRTGKTKPAAIPRVGDEVIVVQTTSGTWVVANVVDKAVGTC